MPRIYTLAKGQALSHREERGGKSPHFQILLDCGGTRVRLAINTRSGASGGQEAELLFAANDDFRHPLTDRLIELPDGIYEVASVPEGLAIDYQRGHLFDPRHMRSIPASRPGDSDPSSSGDHDSGHAAPTYSSDHYNYSTDHPEESPSAGSHPHHPDESHDSVGDYEQYLRDHASLYSPEETHSENIPVEDRDEAPVPEVPPAGPNLPPAEESSSDIPTAEATDRKDDEAPPGPA